MERLLQDLVGGGEGLVAIQEGGDVKGVFV